MFIHIYPYSSHILIVYLLLQMPLIQRKATQIFHISVFKKFIFQNNANKDNES